MECNNLLVTGDMVVGGRLRVNDTKCYYHQESTELIGTVGDGWSVTYIRYYVVGCVYLVDIILTATAAHAVNVASNAITGFYFPLGYLAKNRTSYTNFIFEGISGNDYWTTCFLRSNNLEITPSQAAIASGNKVHIHGIGFLVD